MNDTVFDRIVRGEIKAQIIWEDDHHLAFLSIFPNTPGLTVVIPKAYLGDYAFSMQDDDYTQLLLATKKVARVLERGLGVSRVAMVFEGTGVAYVHAKLYPLYGELASQTDVWSEATEYVETYRGYITTIEGPRMDDAMLAKIQARIRKASSEEPA